MGSNAELAEAAYRAFNLGGVEAILEYLDPEIQWRMWSGFSRTPRVYRGHDGVREVLGMFEENYDRFRAEPQDLIEVGDRVIAPVRLRGIERGSGAEHSFELVQVWTTREERAIRLDVYGSVEEARVAIEEEGTSDSGDTGLPQ